MKPLETKLCLSTGERRSVRWLARAFFANAVSRNNHIAIENSQAAKTNAGTDANMMRLVLCVGQDITDLREAQRLLVRQERLLQSGKP